MSVANANTNFLLRPKVSFQKPLARQRIVIEGISCDLKCLYVYLSPNVVYIYPSLDYSRFCVVE